jgi:hypothetical protein
MNETTDSENRIILHDVRGIGEQFTLLDGVDEQGKVWIYRRLSGVHHCLICGQVVSDGWTRFNDGDSVCNAHVTMTGKMG